MFDNTKQYEVKILIKNRPLTEYHHTDGQCYIEGRNGSEYELEFINHSYEKILIVPAVDGLSVIDGSSAGLDSNGYLINARSNLKIPGWSLDQNNVAKFVFGDVESGYSNKSGQGTSNSGVIGFLVFRERVQIQNTPWIFQNIPYSSPSFGTGVPPLGGSSSQINNIANDGHFVQSSCLRTHTETLKNDLATVFGEKTTFNTHNVNFIKRDEMNPDAVLCIYYLSRKELEKRGIIIKSNSPQAFPRYSTNYCKPPSGWKE